MVTLNEIDKWIDGAEATRLGGHVSPPLRLVNISLMAQAVQFVR